jgi:hypothetical protein
LKREIEKSGPLKKAFVEKTQEKSGLFPGAKVPNSGPGAASGPAEGEKTVGAEFSASAAQASGPAEGEKTVGAEFSVSAAQASGPAEAKTASAEFSVSAAQASGPAEAKTASAEFSASAAQASGPAEGEKTVNAEFSASAAQTNGPAEPPSSLAAQLSAAQVRIAQLSADLTARDRELDTLKNPPPPLPALVLPDTPGAAPALTHEVFARLGYRARLALKRESPEVYRQMRGE